MSICSDTSMKCNRASESDMPREDIQCPYKQIGLLLKTVHQVAEACSVKKTKHLAEKTDLFTNSIRSIG